MSRFGYMDAGWFSWDEFGSVVEDAYGLWPYEFPEREWGRRTWWLVTKETACGDNWTTLGRWIAVFRFLAMTRIYLDFCRMAWGAVRVPFFVEWCERLGVDRETLGTIEQVYDPPVDMEEVGWKYITSGFPGRVNLCIESERGAVMGALHAHHGNAGQIFADLWRSAPPEQQAVVKPGGTAEWAPDGPVGDEFIKTHVIPNQRETLAWIMQGCAPLDPPNGL